MVVFEGATDEDIQKYSELAIKANETIRNNEYEVLPIQLTNGQFKALSNIDKYKYAPMKNKHWTDKSVYFKAPWEQVVETTIPTK